MEKQNAVLMIANSDTAINGFLALQECLEARADVKSHIVCHWRVHVDNAVNRANVCSDKINIIHFYNQDNNTVSGKNKEYHYKADPLVVSLFKSIYNSCRLVGRNLRGMARARRIICNIAPAVILLYADNKAEFEKFFIYWAKRRNIRTVVAPICNTINSVGDILVNPSNGFRLDLHEKLPISAKLVRYIRPKEERVFEGQRVFWGQPFATIIDWAMHLSAPNPWIQGSFADVVCTAYENELQILRQELGDRAEGRLFLTGSVEDDIIFENDRNREHIRLSLNNKYKLQNKVVVIIAFSERIGTVSPEDDLYNKEIVVQSVLKYFSEVLISLHPKSDVNENLFLERNQGCRIVSEPLRQIVSAADVLVCGDVSSVNRWADLLGIEKVTWSSYSMWERWGDSERSMMERQIGHVSENPAVSGGNKGNVKNPRVSFTDFLVNMLSEKDE